jgi:hypothetical protein
VQSLPAAALYARNHNGPGQASLVNLRRGNDAVLKIGNGSQLGRDVGSHGRQIACRDRQNEH